MWVSKCGVSPIVLFETDTVTQLFVKSCQSSSYKNLLLSYFCVKVLQYSWENRSVFVFPAGVNSS